MKDKEKLWKCFPLKEATMTWQLNAIPPSRLNPQLDPRKVFQIALWQQLAKMDFGWYVGVHIKFAK